MAARLHSKLSDQRPKIIISPKGQEVNTKLNFNSILIAGLASEKMSQISIHAAMLRGYSLKQMHLPPQFALCSKLLLTVLTQIC